MSLVSYVDHGGSTHQLLVSLSPSTLSSSNKKRMVYHGCGMFNLSSMLDQYNSSKHDCCLSHESSVHQIYNTKCLVSGLNDRNKNCFRSRVDAKDERRRELGLSLLGQQVAQGRILSHLLLSFLVSFANDFG